ncbi:hypothetical protein [Rheinheimera baltica]|uniref:hypothetical protein n=1 Tax=Rheinheimera baltica TaxID=67576 RepID=UPI0003F6DF56|nr:hypothetical protein [Rheinheimera baltica]
MNTQGFIGSLDIQRRKPEVLPALLGNALLAEDELHIAMQLQFDERLPIVVSFYEYYRFLDRFVSTVLTHELAPRILVRIKMPSTIPLPCILLDARVAIFHDLDVESAELTARGLDHLCIDANFKLYSWSAGDNSFAIRFVSPRGHRLDSAALQQMQDVIATLPANFNCVSSQQPEE